MNTITKAQYEAQLRHAGMTIAADKVAAASVWPTAKDLAAGLAEKERTEAISEPSIESITSNRLKIVG